MRWTRRYKPCSSPSARSATAQGCPTGPSASTRTWPGRSTRRPVCASRSDRDFETTSLSRYGLVTPELHRIDLENFERAADFASEGYLDDDFNALPGRGHARLIPGFPTPLMLDTGGDLTRDYLMAGYRTVYDRFKATPPEGFDEGIVRKWITLQLLAILDDRNYVTAEIVDAILINLEFTQRLHEGWSHNFNVSHAPVNVFATPFPRFFWYSNPAFGALRQREDVYMTDAPEHARELGRHRVGRHRRARPAPRPGGPYSRRRD